MSMWLTNQQLQDLQRGYQKKVECPVRTQVISSGECFPPPQTRQQAQVESLAQEKAEVYSSHQGMPHRTVPTLAERHGCRVSSHESGTRGGLRRGLHRSRAILNSATALPILSELKKIA